MRILITGASGFIGSRIALALAADGHELILAARGRRAAPSALRAHQWRMIDFASAHSPDDWSKMLRGVEVVINAVGIFRQTGAQSFEALHHLAPVALFTAAQAAGVRRIVQISALGTLEQAATRYHQSKLAADNALAGLDMQWVILRPSLVMGGDGASWRFFTALARLPLIPLAGNGDELTQPVAIEDVVRAARLAIAAPSANHQRLDLVSPQPMKISDYLGHIAHWLGRRKKGRVVHVPTSLVRPFVFMARLKPEMPITKEALDMLREANRTYDASPCRKALGFTPQSVPAYLAAHPPQSAVKQAARLYFHAPALRLAIAFMWLWSGIVSMGLYPLKDSLALLAKTGLHGWPAITALYGAALLDIALGLAVLAARNVRLLMFAQIALIAAYTAILSAFAPELWLHPFGPVLKNIPVALAILVWSILEEQS